jgi:SpoVK/Ycf46/Vps4 family AAA+-type ATPase
MPDKALYPRFAEPRLTEALADSLIVLIHGPRQCGKTCIAAALGNRKFCILRNHGLLTEREHAVSEVAKVLDAIRRTSV